MKKVTPLSQTQEAAATSGLFSFISPYRLAMLAPLLWALFSLLRILSTEVGLTGIESYYWDWSRRLDWAYFSKPPLIAYLIWLTDQLIGSSEVSLHLLAWSFYLLTLLSVYLLAQRLYASKEKALIALLLALGLSAINGWWCVTKTDSFLSLFWVLSIYCLYRAVAGDKAMWILTGLSFGLGMLSKYTMLLLGISFFLWILVDARQWLRTPWPYLALLIALLLNSGVLYWNAINDWPSLRHTAALNALEASYTPLTYPIRLAQFLFGQAMWVNPLVALFLLYALFRLLGNLRSDPKARFLLLCFAVPFLFYALLAYSHAIYPHWPQHAYWALAIAFACYWQEKPRRLWLRGLFFFTILSSCLLSMLAPQTHGDSSGPPIGAALSRQLAVYENEDPPFIFSYSERLSAWAAFYTAGRPRTYGVNTGTRRSQYDFWDDWDTLIGRDAILIGHGDKTMAQDHMNRLVAEGVFVAAELLEIIKVPDAKDESGLFFLARLRGYSGGRM